MGHTYSPAAHTLLLLLLLFAVAGSSARECTASDWLAQYTQCRASQNLRDLLYYKDPTSNCSGGVSQPDNKFNLPCDTACAAGSYLPLGELSCQKCSAGSFTVGGGERITDWSTFPTQGKVTFRSYGRNNSDATSKWSCPWTVGVDSSYIQTCRIPNACSTILELPVQLHVAGSISFSYRVDAEPRYDGLTFEIDGATVLTLQSSVIESANFFRNLTSGYHLLAWKFFKDATASQGADAAFISMVEIQGLDYADSSCTLCSPGSYAALEGSTGCTKCARNTYANTSGAASCTACDADKYSAAGSTTCNARATCNSNDYTSYYTLCELRNGLLRRDLMYKWVNTTICNYAVAQLPSSQYDLPCGDCSSGQFRLPGQVQCQWCPVGTVYNGSSCSSCSAGLAAVPSITIDKWHEWRNVPGMSTGCTGLCATSGWELKGSYIDSGLNHGLSVDSFLQFSFNMKKAGTLSFLYSVMCNSSTACSLQIVDVGLSSTSTNKGNNLSMSINLAAGQHTVKWNFNKISTSDSPSYRVVISKIVIVGADVDSTSGPTSCTGCAVGTYSAGNATYCSYCDAGTSSTQNSSSCSLCPANTFNPTSGGSCLPCGNAVTSAPGSLECVSNCTYSPSASINYDLSSLTRDEMYGPVFDTLGQQYWLNVCSRRHTNNTCVDSAGVAIDSYACQVTTLCSSGRCTGKNLGDIIGFYPLPPRNGTEKKGLIIRYTGGSQGCNGVYRSTNISFICKPGAGVGSPVKPSNGKIEVTPCNYAFDWESEYACPVCTSDHYSFYFTTCENNQRQKIYYWKENPRDCHNGVSLPATEIIATNCTSTLVCPAGQFADSDDGSVECDDCEAGTYSVGAGVDYPTFLSVPSILTSSCEPSETCSQWYASGGKLWSGVGTSRLQEAARFIAKGSVSFTYQTFFSLSSASFSFSVDGKKVLSVNKNVLEPATFNLTVGAGVHVLLWEFIGGSTTPSSDTFSAVSIHSLTILSNQYSSIVCQSCQLGQVQPNTSATSCVACDENTHAISAITCSPCATGYFAPKKSHECYIRPTCSENDFQLYYTPCVNGTRSSFVKKLLPAVCTRGFTPANTTTGLSCGACMKGLYRNGDACVGCPAGTVLDESAGSCVAVVNGSIAISSLTYFGDNTVDMGEEAWPEGFSSSCSGDCLTSSGWVPRGSFVGVAKGVTVGSSVSVLTYKSTLVTSGSLSFDYTLTGIGDVVVFANGIRVPLPSDKTSGSVTAALSSGDLEISFIALMPQGNLSSTPSIANIKVSGLATGAGAVVSCPSGQQNVDAKTCAACAPGTANAVESGVCTPCSTGTYSDTAGSSTCLQCGYGSYPEKTTGSTYCRASCYYTYSSGNASYSFNLTTIAEPVGPIADTTGRLFYLSLCSRNLSSTPCHMSSHVCQVDTTTSSVIKNFGSRPAFRGVSSSGFALTFRNGDATGNCSSTGRETIVNFECDLSVGQGLPQYISQLDSDPCSVAFLWKSTLACPVCVRSDYDEVRGSCSGGKRTVELVRKSKCNGPISIPESTSSCTDMSVPIAVVASIAGVVVVLVAAIAFFVWRNRTITTKYQQLLNDHPLELADGE